MREVARGPASVAVLHGTTPLAALQLLGRTLPQSSSLRAQWRAQARTVAVLGSAPKSNDELLSAVSHWLKYVALVHGTDAADSYCFPPSLSHVLGWSNTFRCATYGNYLSKLRGACHAMGYDAPPCNHRAIKRATVGIVMRAAFRSRDKMFISRLFLKNIVLGVAKGQEEKKYAMLWLFTYLCLLRLPSEALPAIRSAASEQATDTYCPEGSLKGEGSNLHANPLQKESASRQRHAYAGLYLRWRAAVMHGARVVGSVLRTLECWRGALG